MSMEKEQFRKIREDLGLTQAQIGRAFGQNGTYVSDIERGLRKVEPKAVEALINLGRKVHAKAAEDYSKAIENSQSNSLRSMRINAGLSHLALTKLSGFPRHIIQAVESGNYTLPQKGRAKWISACKEGAKRTTNPLARKVTAARLNAGLTQREMAKILGVSNYQVHAMETSPGKAQTALITAVLDAFKRGLVAPGMKPLNLNVRTKPAKTEDKVSDVTNPAVAPAASPPVANTEAAKVSVKPVIKRVHTPQANRSDKANPTHVTPQRTVKLAIHKDKPVFTVLLKNASAQGMNVFHSDFDGGTLAVRDNLLDEAIALGVDTTLWNKGRVESCGQGEWMVLAGSASDLTRWVEEFKAARNNIVTVTADGWTL